MTEPASQAASGTTTEAAIVHVDEAGAPCARHRPASPAGLMQLAMVGSRAPAFHHDCASKLQGLVMALDELTELTENAGDPHVTRAIEAAVEASRELNALLNVSRALTKPAARAPSPVATLVAAAAARVNVVLQGALPDAMVAVTLPPVTHALALVIDVAAGTGRGRALGVASRVEGDEVELAIQAAPSQPASAGESLAIAAFVVAREGGRLWCASAGDRVFVRLPRA